MVYFFTIMSGLSLAASISFLFVREPEKVAHLRSMDITPGASPKNNYQRNLKAIEAEDVKQGLIKPKVEESEFKKDIRSVITLLKTKRIRPILL